MDPDRAYFSPFYLDIIDDYLRDFCVIQCSGHYFAENGEKGHFGENPPKTVLIGAKESKPAKLNSSQAK